jgi:hypothetical protein
MGCGCNSSCDCSQVITIPTGGKGDKGDPGNDGAPGTDGTNGTDGTGTPGTDGTAATIAVGTVTTGAPGSSVVVSNSGTSSAATFDFTIPAGAAGSGASITTVTHAELLSLIGSDGLTPGGLYRMAYQTLHLIGGTSQYNYNTTTYDSGTGLNQAFVPTPENFLLRAITVDDIDIRVLSESYPRDIIYYDWSLVTTEDGIGARPGFITYRENPDDDVSAPYDFRNVLHRRYHMDTSGTTDRDTEFGVALGSVPGSTENHGLHHLSGLPPLVSNISGSNATIGIYDTARVGTHKDFKTFVGYGDNLWTVTGSTSTEKPRFKNVHVKHSDKVARVNGSTAGQTIELDEPSGGGTEGQYYPSLSNVVIFSRAAENIIIGANAAGVTITGRVNENIVIGHNCENINIGSPSSTPDYTGSSNGNEPKMNGAAENISIGNNNRNIVITNLCRGIEIGDSNIGILLNYYCHNVTIGSYNSMIYHYAVHDCYIEDWSNTIRISQSNNLKIESKQNIIDILRSQGSPASGLGGFGTSIPVGLGDSVVGTSESGEVIEIKARCKKICLLRSAGVIIEGNVENIFMIGCHNIKIGSNCKFIDMELAFWVTIGIGCQKLEMMGCHNSSFGSGVMNSKVFLSTYVTIGDYVDETLIYGGSVDVKIESNCNNILIINGISVEIENTTNTVYLRNCEAFKIGERSHDIYANLSNNCSVGADCDDVVFNNINITEKPTHLTDQGNFRYKVADTRALTYGSGTPHVPADNPTMALEANQDLCAFLTAAGIAAPQSSIEDNHVGNDCNDVYIINSRGNTVGNNCSNIRFGNATVPNYSLVYTSGVSDPTGSSPQRTATNIAAIPNFSVTGQTCDLNTVGNNCATIHFLGANKTHNIIGNNLNSIIASEAHSFGNNRVLVDGAPVTTTASHINKIFNFKDSTLSAGRWAHVVNTTSGTIEPVSATSAITITGSGTVTNLTYNSVSIINTSPSYKSGKLVKTADRLLNNINAGTNPTNCVNATYTNVVLVGGSGLGGKATVVCTSTTVTGITVTAGIGYAPGDAMTISAGDLGGGSSQVSFTLEVEDLLEPTIVTGSTTSEMAMNLAIAINSYPSVPNYTATATGSVLTVILDKSQGDTLNGFNPTVTGVTTIVGPLSGGINAGTTHKLI